MADNEFLTGYLSGQSENRNSGNGLFGGGWEGIIGLIVILALLGGAFGMGGGGFGGGMGGGQMSGIATRADINWGFQFQDLQNGIRGLTNGLSDATFALNNTITNGFHGVDNAICNLGYSMKDCCCQTQRAIDGVNFNMAKGFCDLGNVMNQNTRDIIDAQNSGTRAVLDFLVQEKLAAKDATIADLRMQISQSNQNAYFAANQEAQTATLLRRLGADCPTPAYLVQPPTPVNFPTNGCGTVQFGNNGYNGGCGCGCG